MIDLIWEFFKPCNVLLSGGKLKINDFNLGFPMFLNKTSNSACDAYWPHQCDQLGKVTYLRSPEECGRQQVKENSDTYSLGTVIYFILTGTKPYRKEPVYSKKGSIKSFAALNKTEYTHKIQNGKLPYIPSFDSLSNGCCDTGKHRHAYKALKKSIEMALTFDSRKRPSATDILIYLKKSLNDVQI